MRISVLKLNIFHSLYVNKKYVIYEHIWVCCGCDVTVKYDAIDSHIETIHSISANSIESYTVIVVANKKFINELLRALRESDVSGHHIAKVGCRLENCCTPASLIVRCLRFQITS